MLDISPAVIVVDVVAVEKENPESSHAREEVGRAMSATERVVAAVVVGDVVVDIVEDVAAVAAVVIVAR